MSLKLSTEQIALAAMTTLNSLIPLLHRGVNALMYLGSFLNSIQRVTQKDYEPSMEDISRASMEDQDVRNVMIPRKSAGRRSCYRFIDTVASNASGDPWIDASEDISLVVQVVDMEDFNLIHFGDTSSYDAQQDVILFKRICSSRWLAETPVLVLLSNADKMTEKMECLPPQQQSTCDPRVDLDAASVKSFFRRLFLHAETKYKTNIWIKFIGSGVNADIGKKVVCSIDKTLTEQSVLNYGIR